MFGTNHKNHGNVFFGDAMTLSRRRFIQASGLAVCLGSLPLSVRAADEGGSQPLPVPPLLESRNGQPLFLTMQRTHWSFNGKNQASVWGLMAVISGRLCVSVMAMISK
ncbi:hypothetical protein UA45_21285 [Morganella morganii]|uniref:Cell division protein FtsP n=1 Tax=Morganella morganii TaxID=582 RepID=A0A0D8L1S1_MORMO|nr:hypothetical protein UA45_21285 [Morganella morganii]